MVERIKKARLIYNPTSGQEIIKKNIAEVLDVLEDVGYETSAYQTTPEPFSAQNEAERAAKAGFDLIIAAGGDGTINEVVNGVAGLENRPQMAFIPTGTTNDLCACLEDTDGRSCGGCSHYRKESNHSNGHWSCLWQQVFHQHCCSRNHDRIDLQCSK